MRQKAGAAVGSAEAVAFVDPDGQPLTTFKLDYDYIDLDGKVSARDLIVYGSDNLVPDDQLQVGDVWGTTDNAEWTLIQTHGAAVGQVARRGALHRHRHRPASRSFPAGVPRDSIS